MISAYRFLTWRVFLSFSKIAVSKTVVLTKLTFMKEFFVEKMWHPFSMPGLIFDTNTKYILAG